MGGGYRSAQSPYISACLLPPPQQVQAAALDASYRDQMRLAQQQLAEQVWKGGGGGGGGGEARGVRYRGGRGGQTRIRS